jgi:hypothetical protein
MKFWPQYQHDRANDLKDQSTFIYLFIYLFIYAFIYCALFLDTDSNSLYDV